MVLKWQNKWLTLIIFLSMLSDIFTQIHRNSTITLSNIVYLIVKNFILLIAIIFLYYLISHYKKNT